MTDSTVLSLDGNAETVAYEALECLVKSLRETGNGSKSQRAQEVARAGGVTAVLGAMAAHVDSQRVQELGAEALYRMVVMCNRL